MNKQKYYTQDYSLLAQAERMLYDTLTELRKDDTDLHDIRLKIEACRELVNEYTSKSNLVEDEEGSLLMRETGNTTLLEVADELKGWAQRSGATASFRMNTRDGFLVEVSAREMTEEEKQKDKEEEDEV